MQACRTTVGETTRVLLVEDHALFRQSLSLLLHHHLQIEVIQVGTLAEARRLLNGVNVAALKSKLPDGAGIDLIGDVRANNPGASVLVLSNSSDPAYFEAAFEAGADTVLSKIESPFRIIEEIGLLGNAARRPRPIDDPSGPARDDRPSAR